MAQITLCTSFANCLNSLFFSAVIHSIRQDSNPEDLVITHLKDGDSFGTHALNRAAFVGNIGYIRDIYNRGGVGLLSLGDKYGNIPLHRAVHNRQLSAAKQLILLNSPINMTTTAEVPYSLEPCEDSPAKVRAYCILPGAGRIDDLTKIAAYNEESYFASSDFRFPAHSTPLDHAFIMRFVPMVKILMRYGGQRNVKASYDESVHQQAVREIQAENFPIEQIIEPFFPSVLLPNYCRLCL